MKRKISIFVLGAFLAALALSPLVYANYGMHGKCSMGGGQWGHGGYGGHSENKCPITGMFFWTAHEMMEHKTDLGLTPEQIQTIRGLKLDMKKQSIRKMADMQIMMVDMHAKLKEETLDTEGLNKMIDEGFTGMADGAKQAVDAYAKLKAVLTPEQVEKWAALKEKHHHKEGAMTEQKQS